MAAARLEVCVLGPLELRLDGAVLPLAGVRQRALLALLAIHANTPVSSYQLADELWSESPPLTAQASLRVAISKLRRVLGDAQRALETVPGGYRLALSERELDRARFETLVAQARAEPAQARTLLSEALALWRGPPFADLAEHAPLSTEAARLAELRLAAREELAAATLALGRDQELVPELAALVDESPYRERPRALLMLALYRSGRQAEALAAYGEAREVLQRDLGLEPGEELRQLERAILTHDPSLRGPARPADADIPTRRRWRRLAVAGSIAVVAAAAGGVVASRSGGDPAAASVAPAHSLALVAPGIGRLMRVKLGWTPTQIALAGHSLWLLDGRDRTVVRLDVKRRRVVRTIGLGVEPTAVAVGDGAIWVLAAPARTLFRIDPANGVVRTTRVPLGNLSIGNPLGALGNPLGLAVSREGVWIEDGASALFLVSPRTGAVRRFTLGPAIDGIAVGAGSVWVTQGGSQARLLRVDPHKGRVTARIPLSTVQGAGAPYPIGVTFGSGAVWVLNGNTGTVSRIDATLDAVTATVPRISMDPIRIVAGDGAVWIADGENGSLDRIDPATAEVTRTILVGGVPTSLAAGRAGLSAAIDAS
jgi:DNA-binding SARP family transcriptional activator/DNA-binding beta-propeller fold protein YncE